MRLNYIGRRTAVAMAIIALVAVALGILRARAQSFTLSGLARTVSAYTIVDKVCELCTNALVEMVNRMSKGAEQAKAAASSR
jgi:hypothetical protein